jgi:hypothetical protein
MLIFFQNAPVIKTVVNFEGTVDRDFGIFGHANLKMLHSKSKTQFVKQERNTQKAIALLNYLKRIAP